MTDERVVIDGERLTLEDVAAVARFGVKVTLAPGSHERIDRCRAIVGRLLESRAVVYGLTTGFGSLRDILISPNKVQQLQWNLIRSHSAGVGTAAAEDVVRAMLLLRANTLAKGFSGARRVVVERLIEMLNGHVFPVVPLQGSVGASGDLAPLSHLALVLLGEGEAYLPDGRRVNGAEAMKAAGVEPVVLEAKEGLALNNGTQFMTAIGTLALLDAECAARAAALACALSLEGIKGVPRALEARLHEVRPHPGQIEIAQAIRERIAGSQILRLPVNTAHVHNAITFLESAREVLVKESSERCQTAAYGIEELRKELHQFLGSIHETIDSEVARGRKGKGDAEPEEELRRQGASTIVGRYVSATLGIYEQVLSGSLPRAAVGAQEHLKRALDELQKAVPDYTPVQDDYSFRCAPQVIGPALDTFAHVRRVLRCELNSATDNPLIFAPAGRAGDDPEVYARALTLDECKQAVISGGNFHGEPIAIALDQACIALAEIGNISERRTFHLVSRHHSNGLPSFLIREVGLQSGLMIAQYTAAALVSENKTLCHPASVDSIPTCENAEDHVSMGAYAARKFAEVVQNVYRIIAVELICAAQGVELREPARPSPANQRLVEEIRAVCPKLETDRPLGKDIEEVARLIHERRLTGLASQTNG